MILGTRPGTTAGEVLAAAQRAYARVGFPDEWRLHHQGGAIGYQPREYNAFPGSPEVILANQAFAWNPSICGTKSEDTILAGPAGPEVLTCASGDWPAVEIEVTMPERMKRRGIAVTAEQSGSELLIQVEGVIRFFRFLSAGKTIISISAPVATDLEIETSSGSITVEGIATRAVSLEASSGNINITDIDAEITATCSSGDISVESCEGAKILESSSGNITVRNSPGDIDTESSSGRQTYVNIAGSIISRSSSGTIGITGAEGAFELRASSGNIEGSEMTLIDDSSFQTSSGSIDVDYTNSLDELAFSLSSTSGKINAGSTNAKGTVKTGSGGIQIEGKSTSGRQTYR